MSRINTNVSALVAQNNLQRSNSDLRTSLQRLSTGLRINRGADDPAGLIVSERLRSEISAVDQATDNIERASNVIATTEAGLQEINTLLVSIKSLTIEAANTGALSSMAAPPILKVSRHIFTIMRAKRGPYTGWAGSM